MLDYGFTAADLLSMRDIQNAHMQDHCVILSYTAGTLNEYNEADAPTYTETTLYTCGLNMRPNQRNIFEAHKADMTEIQYDADIRLPVNAQLKETDRIKVYARFNEYPDSMTYEIVSPIQRGASGVRILCRKIVV